jgi:hypothetical protein
MHQGRALLVKNADDLEQLVRKVMSPNDQQATKAQVRLSGARSQEDLCTSRLGKTKRRRNIPRSVAELSEYSEL